MTIFVIFLCLLSIIMGAKSHCVYPPNGSKELDFSGCHIKEIPSDLARLYPDALFISFANNNITKVGFNDFADFKSLKILNLAGNRIVFDLKAPLLNQSSLRDLDLSDNGIYQLFLPVHFRFLTNLRTLRLDGNNSSVSKHVKIAHIIHHTRKDQSSYNSSLMSITTDGTITNVSTITTITSVSDNAIKGTVIDTPEKAFSNTSNQYKATHNMSSFLNDGNENVSSEDTYPVTNSYSNTVVWSVFGTVLIFIFGICIAIFLFRRKAGHNSYNNVPNT